VNAIYIASPHARHTTHVKLAAEAGKIVLCEKPGDRAAEAQAVRTCAAWRAAGVAYYRRFGNRAQMRSC
jgi:predicted dehydrogenase